MDPMQKTELARSFHREHGENARAKATAKVRSLDQAGRTEEANRWRDIRSQIPQKQDGR